MLALTAVTWLTSLPGRVRPGGHGRGRSQGGPSPVGSGAAPCTLKLRAELKPAVEGMSRAGAVQQPTLDRLSRLKLQHHTLRLRCPHGDEPGRPIMGFASGTAPEICYIRPGERGLV